MIKQCIIIKSAMKYVKQAHDSAECRHDSYGEYYMDLGQYEIMQETEKLLAGMVEIINKLENKVI